MLYLSAVPADGRDYETEAEVRDAWAKGEDFQVTELRLKGRVNNDSLPDKTQVNVLFNKGTEICVLVRDDEAWAGIDPNTPGVIG